LKESALAALTFWSAFAFSIGPFWIATMDAAKHTSFYTLYRNYLIYMFVGWLPINFFIGMVVGTVGKINEDIYTVMYFIGAGVIFWLAYRVMGKSGGDGKPFEFNWKTMVLVSWTNPKVWLTLPAGYLAANFTGNLPVDVLIFFFIGSPLFIAGVYIWGMIGRQGAKIARQKIGYFNAALLAGFAGYLLYQGFGLLLVA
jgi:hypothetical protein